jgi:lysophospholipase L1-like esterase
VNFIDCSMVFKDSTADLYFDGCHFNEAGHVLLAEAIAPFLLKCLDSPHGFRPAGETAESEPRSR